MNSIEQRKPNFDSKLTLNEPSHHDHDGDYEMFTGPVDAATRLQQANVQDERQDRKNKSKNK